MEDLFIIIVCKNGNKDEVSTSTLKTTTTPLLGRERRRKCCVFLYFFGMIGFFWTNKKNTSLVVEKENVVPRQGAFACRAYLSRCVFKETSAELGHRSAHMDEHK
ncbi:hypothetical protein Syun_013545 [Stephania yunnanensis]|uniref:Uncharacterized protein n=1 Tax=Stephania yunnanensis TaxID=152371 RepID=A0AAP0PAY5_9MAGN